MSFSLYLSKTDYDTAVTRFPASVPASWVGADSTACQLALDEAPGPRRPVGSRYGAAFSDVGVIDARSSSSGTSPS